MDMVTFFSLLGGLGLFLLGMKDMSEGLEKAAGARICLLYTSDAADEL